MTAHMSIIGSGRDQAHSAGSVSCWTSLATIFAAQVQGKSQCEPTEKPLAAPTAVDQPAGKVQELHLHQN